MSSPLRSRKTKRAQSHPLHAVVSLQDAGAKKLTENDVPVYHTHGLRQYMGDAKYHKRLDCPHLTNWKPGKGLGKTIMREWESQYEDVPPRMRCRTCFAG
jgi:hypothetical protein